MSEIAIIGLAGKFPGARDTDQFFENIWAGLESITFFPREFLREKGLLAALIDDPSYVRAASLMPDAKKFDAKFFRYSAREARLLDPQQRCFLECAWSALENAGYSQEKFDYPVGVFAGASANTYLLDHLQTGSVNLNLNFPDFIEMRQGYDKDFLATRVSYELNLTGPSFVIQSACSTSLVVVHTACQSLLNGECEMAIAGAVTILYPLEQGYLYKPGSIVSPDGHCRAFSAKAQGTIFGSGVGVVVLKRLEDAVHDGDHIWAVIKGSAINNDGGVKPSFTAPSLEKQADAIITALEMSSVAPESIGYIEAHGTGTPIGDPVEIAALTRAYKIYTEAKQFCALGSVKTNIGHLDVAAGMAGLIKTIYILNKKSIPPSLHFDEANPSIDFAGSPFYVNTTLKPFTRDGLPRRAAINSLGVGGTNAHMILEEAPQMRDKIKIKSPQTLVISAKTPSALQAYKKNLHAHFVAQPDIDLVDTAFTLQEGRVKFEYAETITCNTLAEAISKLKETTPHHDALYPSQETGNRIPLPTYPFEGEEYSFNASQKQSLQPLLHTHIHNQMMNAAIFESSVDFQHFPYLAQHRVYGVAIIPGAFHIAMVLSAYRNTPVEISDFIFGKALFIDEDNSRTVQVVINTENAQTLPVKIISYKKSNGLDKEPWQLHSQCCLLKGTTHTPISRINRDAIKLNCVEPVDPDNFYQDGLTRGFEWQGAFRALHSLWRCDGEALACVQHPADVQADSQDYAIHPAILDVCLQPYLLALPKNGIHAQCGDPYIPLSIAKLTYYKKPAANLWVHVSLPDIEKMGMESFLANVMIADDNGDVVMQIEGLRVVRMPRQQLKQIASEFLSRKMENVYLPQWQIMPSVTAAAPSLPTIIIISHELDQWQFSDKLAKFFADKNVVRITLSTEFKKYSSTHCQIDYRDSTHFARVVSFIPDVSSIYFLGGLKPAGEYASELELFTATQDMGVMALFQLCRALMSSKSHTQYQLKIVTADLYHVSTEDKVLYPFSGSLMGFAKVFARENPHIAVSCIDYSSGDLNTLQNEKLFAALITEPATVNVNEIAWRNGCHFVKKLINYSAVENPQQVPTYRKNGVYLIIGGAGGIGVIISCYMAEKYQTRIIWTGRRPIDKDIEANINKIKSLGGEAVYFQADANNIQQMETVIKKAKDRFGAIHGVFHSSLVLRDSSIANMTLEDFHAAFDIKAKASVVLQHVTRHDDLDFIAYFSSENALRGWYGLSNYVAGCAFKDNYAYYLQYTMNRKVKIFNWGFWGEAGIAARSPAIQEKIQKQGIFPMTSAETINILNAMLKSDFIQVIPTKISAEVNEFLNIDVTATLSTVENKSSISMLNVAAAINTFTVKSSGLNDNKIWLAELNRIAGLQVLKLFKESGVDIVSNKTFLLSNLIETLHAQEKFRPLLQAMLDILVRSEFINRTSDIYLFSDKTINKITAQEIQQLPQILGQLQDEYFQSAPWVKLLAVAVNNFKTIIQGFSRATDHFFPQSSFELVESIYSHNKLSNYFHEMLAEAVMACLQDNEKIRILEFGAGTGSTAQMLLKRLKPYSDRIEYVFTDVSPHFVNRAKQELSAEYPFVSFATLDIEQDLQGFDSGSFDIVLGTNVLHIAANLFASIGWLKRLLKKDGLFIINELTRSFDIYTLTFGLLDGWWLTQDNFLRLPHSPLLGSERWRFILDVAGFRQINIFSEENAIQSLIIAASDGLIKSSASIPAPLRINTTDVIVDKALSFADVESAALPKRRFLLQSFIKQQITGILEISSTEEINMDRPLSDLGMDSLIVIDFCNSLSKTIGKMISTNIIFDYPTVSSLIDHIAVDILHWREDIADNNTALEIEEMLKLELGESA